MSDAPLAAVPERSPLAGHILALDGVRGLAILLVLGFHFIAHGPGSTAWPVWVQQATQNGWAGVDLFFVLSGFLITRILLQLRGRPGAMRVFYVRRALRIFPAYYALLAVVCLYVLVRSGFAPTRGETAGLAAVAAYATNFNVALHDNWGVAVFRSLQLTHLWTLAIEEQFYLLWPLVVLWLPRRGALAVGLGLILIGPAWRALLLSSEGRHIDAYVLTPCRADSLAWGAIVAFCESYRPRWLRPLGGLLLAGGLAGLGVIAWRADSQFWWPWWTQTEYERSVQLYGYTALATLSAGVIALAAARALPRPLHAALASRPLARLGRYSYGIYLIHLPLRGIASAVWRAAGYDPALVRDVDNAWFGTPLTLTQAALTALLLIAASLFLAGVSFHLFEQRFLRRKPTIDPPVGFEPIFKRD